MSPLDSGIFAGAQGRFQRFEKVFLALDQLGDYINSVLSSEDMRIRDGREQDLSLLVVAALGKGLKTFQAISNLCLLGRGEGALVLLRSNVNLLINLAYIRSADEPVDRADD